MVVEKEELYLLLQYSGIEKVEKINLLQVFGHAKYNKFSCN